MRNGVEYRYEVRATGPDGESLPSAVSAVPFRNICVTDSSGDRIVVYDAERLGLDAPSRAFGSLTGMAPNTIALDSVHGEIFAANSNGTVTEHASSANGNVPPLRSVQFAFGPFAIAYDADEDHLITSGSGGIETFDRATFGDVNQPIRTLVLPFLPAHIALSGAAHGDRMFVEDGSSNDRIFVYSRTDSGTAAPSAVVTSNEMSALHSIAYDAASDEVLASVSRPDGTPAVLAFPAASNGLTTPSRVLAGDLTGLQLPTGLAVDPATNSLYVAQFQGAILTFSRDFAADANVAPVRELRGPSTQLSFGGPRDLLFDAVRGRLVIQNEHRVLMFDPQAGGDAAPVSGISAASTGLESPGGIFYDAAQGQLFVATQGQSPGVSVYTPAAEGDVVPLRRLANPNPGFGTSDLVVDVAHGEIVVVPGNLDRVQIFAEAFAGGDAPMRTIVGDQTLLVHASGVALDPINDAILVSDDAVIRRFARSFVDGNEAPLSSISGPRTGLLRPHGIHVDAVNREIVVADDAGVLVFALDAAGDVSPVRTLNVPARGVYVDPVADEL
ncbi:MAG: hypothetical protein ACM3SX_06375, partial [Deltaproteobacteria bacterium]